ncbi:hypothetical protein OEV98_15100 [Caldibacillus lycopersici]|uniref:Uncharacterized protein n=1 Tax=Perspicuibacillus lycopersici TaxID=1325689 RepID=A0AAE3IUH7_9BACI|nr:hypothetical protein [Perspicuibacillus lycopersici]MCU9614870.1 hypothetical protein [Perspicuibacillus lycopersici]
MDKIKALPEKTAFIIGIILSVSSSLLFFPIGNWIMFVLGAICCILGILFILHAANKRQARIGKNHKD